MKLKRLRQDLDLIDDEIELGDATVEDKSKLQAQLTDITDGDTFSLFMGCDKLKETCKARPTAGAESSAPGTLGNFLNFGGFTFLVGTTTLIKTGEYRNS